MLPAYDWSVVRIYPCFLRLIGTPRSPVFRVFRINVVPQAHALGTHTHTHTHSHTRAVGGRTNSTLQAGRGKDDTDTIIEGEPPDDRRDVLSGAENSLRGIIIH
eukprot:6225655-Pyramimonas_sp.AAC.1